MKLHREPKFFFKPSMPWFLTVLRATPYYKAEVVDFNIKHIFFDYSTLIAQMGAYSYGLGSVKNRKLCARIEKQSVVDDSESETGENDSVECFVPVQKADMLYSKRSQGLCSCEQNARYIIVIGKEEQVETDGSHSSSAAAALQRDSIVERYDTFCDKWTELPRL